MVISKAIKRFAVGSALSIVVLFSHSSLAHVGDSYECAAVISASCGDDFLCMGLSPDGKGALPMLFKKKAVDVRAGDRVYVHGTKLYLCDRL